MWERKFDKTDRKKFLHLVDYIIEAIDSGKLSQGQSLPTQRELSRKLGVSIGTITKAFKELEKLGYLQGEVGRGTFVKDISAEYADFWYAESKLPYKYNFGNFRTTELFNHTVQLHLLQAIRNVSADASLFQKLNDLHNAGAIDQKKAFLEWLKFVGIESAEVGNINLLASDFLTTKLIIETCSKPGDTIIFESWSDPTPRDQARSVQRNIAAVRLDDDGIDPEHLEQVLIESGSNLIFTNPTLQNPTGITSSLARKKEILAICDRYNAYIVELGNQDFFATNPIVPYFELNPRVGIYVSNLYFHISPSLNSSQVVASVEITRKLEQLFKVNFWSSSQLLLEISSRLVSTTGYKIVLEKKRMIARRNHLLEMAFDQLPESASGSVLRWLPIGDAWTSSALTQAAYESGILIRNSDIFSFQVDGPSNFVRLSLGAIHDIGEFETGVKALRSLWQSPPVRF